MRKLWEHNAALKTNLRSNVCVESDGFKALFLDLIWWFWIYCSQINKLNSYCIIICVIGSQHSVWRWHLKCVGKFPFVILTLGAGIGDLKSGSWRYQYVVINSFLSQNYLQRWSPEIWTRSLMWTSTLWKKHGVLTCVTDQLALVFRVLLMLLFSWGMWVADHCCKDLK